MPARTRRRRCLPAGNPIASPGRRFAAAVALLIAAAASSLAGAADPLVTLERSRTLEAEGLAKLAELYRFEETLMTEDNDRVIMFLSMPHGARVIMDELTLYVDDRPVVRDRFSVTELMQLQGRAVKLLHVTRLPAGGHSVRIDIKVMQGRINAMQPYLFTKSKASKFIEFVVTGAPVRQIDVLEW